VKVSEKIEVITSLVGNSFSPTNVSRTKAALAKLKKSFMALFSHALSLIKI